ncbi:endonuclease (plasmid) [Hymenobacter sp. NBH84]|uniref:Z1 domain-containing protein n=1 Tax=Hymenobacter sp. NBH84 TaxID=2596915 RepID=UPI001626CFF1|nr:Z1 domain-containing protein [Hymenobacter sp. NBH84]QNE42033.1 endonuclease [Hymenobacter sp. NBH84]
MNSQAYEQTRKSAIGLFSGVLGATEEELRETIVFLSKRTGLTAGEQENLVNELLADYAVISQDYKILDGDDPEHKTWLFGSRGNIDWKFWKRYEDYLEQQVKLPVDTINNLDKLTNDVLDRITNPKQQGPWDRRGMVVGHVQSGKTGNYTGLICKAADAGYRVIIVLTGLHSSLRSQTQYRLDEGFLGRDTKKERAYHPGGNGTDVIGAGLIRPTPSAQSVTTSAENGDFNAGAATASGVTIKGSDPVLIVVKKNGSVLNNLLRWLGAQGERVPGERNARIVRGLPMLLIDDEADNASINVSPRAISTINSAVRALLTLFEQNAYVGYTATPYANIFIQMLEEAEYTKFKHTVRNRKTDAAEFDVGQDLFPRDFIVNLPAPSNYIGAGRLFGLGGPLTEDAQQEEDSRLLPVIRPVRDYATLIPDGHTIRSTTKRESTPLPTDIPASLKEAIRCFVLTCATRRVRGQGHRHSSMLIHVSRFVIWQDRIADEVYSEMKSLQDDLRYGTAEIIDQMRQLWEKDYRPVTEQVLGILTRELHWRDPAIRQHTWEEVLTELSPAAQKIQVRISHGGLDYAGSNPLHRPLNYVDYEAPAEGTEAGLSVIAIGGDKLSRGLTLEGLSVSYFLRASRMYDTLMQMGRWFGYRPGYADLCRLYTTPQLIEWYQYIAYATEEMREQFDDMVRLNSTPLKYGIKIRTLPGVLQITAANRMRGATIIELSYANSLLETSSFEINQAVTDHNYHLVRNLVEGMTQPRVQLHGQPFAWQDVPAEVVIDFLKNYSTSQAKLDRNKLTQYIQLQNQRHTLTHWTVVLINADRSKGNENPFFDFPIPDLPADQQKVQSTLRSHARPRNQTPEEKKLPVVPPADGPYMISRSHIISPRHEMLDLTPTQVKKASADYRAAKRTEYDEQLEKARIAGRSEPVWIEPDVTVPSGTFIRGARSSRNGLLLLYPLDPAAAGLSKESPVMGYALSIPHIEGDERVKFAADQTFIREFYSGGSEYDPDEEVLIK